MDKLFIMKYIKEILNSRNYYYKEDEGTFYMNLAKSGRKCAFILVALNDGISGYFAYPWLIQHEPDYELLSSINSINTCLKTGCLYIDDRTRSVVYRNTQKFSDIFVIEESIEDLINNGFSVFLKLWDRVFNMIHGETGL